MGITTVPVISKKSCRSIHDFGKAPFVVDTGAVDCVVPRQHIWKAIGLDS